MKNKIEKNIKMEVEYRLEREARQTKQLQEYLKKVSRIPQLTSEEENKLWKRKKIIETGSDEILERRIFNAYRKLAISVANELIKKPEIKKILTRLELILLAEKMLPGIIKSYAWHRERIKSNFSQYATNALKMGLIRDYIDISRILQKGEPLSVFLQRKKETNKKIRIKACGEREGIRVLEEFSGHWKEFERYIQEIPEKKKWKMLTETEHILDPAEMSPF